MRWVVGLELRGIGGGALRWGLALTRRQSATDRLYGVHLTSREDHAALARRALREYAEDRGALERFADLRAAESDDYAQGLSDAFDAYQADALVLGRHAPLDGSGWTRLGRIARRLLRSLPGPVFVVPPDWSSIRPGPVVAAVDLRPDCIDACRFASEVARAIDRPLQLVHVAPSTHGWTGSPLGPSDLGSIEAEHRVDARARLDGFVGDNALPHDSTRILQGDPVDELLAHVTHTEAATIVLGSRRLGVLGRIFSASVGIELAGTAPCPVAVVPRSG